MNVLRPVLILAGLITLWQAVVWATGWPPYILPGPAAAASAWIANSELIARHGALTLAEILLGLVAGVAFGGASAVVIAYFRPVRRWLLPVLVISQAIPVFALAPVLVLWLGYGIASKVAMASLIIFFPVAASFYDGLRRTESGWLDLADTMNASRWNTLRQVRIPAALPSLASGLRVAVAVAPIGAVVGEWVGSSAGLGHLMLHANARLQVDLMFAALATLALIALALYFAVDQALRRALPWIPETSFDSERGRS
ncbi:MAG: ABC transporter permease [Rhodospirillales bacterium]|nr:ABC transporter permease [Rhodospirillales bacterium]